MKRWVIDRGGLRHSACCVAHADDINESEHPVNTGYVWHIYESARGCHLPDRDVGVIIPPNTPVALVKPAQEPTVVPPAKRQRVLENVGQAGRWGSSHWSSLFGA